MNAQQWLDQFRGELDRHKLPPLYSERLLSELSDHITDFLEDPMSTEALDRPNASRTLGRPAEVAQTAASEYRQRKFLGRHPLLGFVALPIVTLPVLWAVTVFTFAMVAKLCGFGSNGTLSTAELPPWVNYSLATVVFGLVLVPIALAAWLFCYVARSSGVTTKWPLIACLILAVIGSPAFLDVALPGTNQRGLLHDTQFCGKSARTKRPPRRRDHGHGFRPVEASSLVADRAVLCAAGDLRHRGISRSGDPPPHLRCKGARRG